HAACTEKGTGGVMSWRVLPARMWSTSCRMSLYVSENESKRSTAVVSSHADLPRRYVQVRWPDLPRIAVPSGRPGGRRGRDRDTIHTLVPAVRGPRARRGPTIFRGLALPSPCSNRQTRCMEKLARLLKNHAKAKEAKRPRTSCLRCALA